METYWKSTVASQNIKPRIPNKPLLSTNTSPSIQSPSFGTSSGGVLVSSLRGVYVHAVIQMTKDMVPVVFSKQVVPINDVVSMGIADLTLAQVIPLVRSKFAVYTSSHVPNSTAEWISLVNTGFLTLQDILLVSEFPFLN